MSNVQSYNALIDRFKAFASGHFILKTFSHGQIDTADLEKFTEYPFMHVVPSNVTYAKGTKTFSFQIVLADLPRDKDDKVEFQREVLSDLQRIAEDLVAEITNHRVLFGDLITVQNVTLEPFLEEFHNTLTGWTVSLDLLVPYYWDACSIPAEWNDMFESSTGGTGSILTFIDSITRDENGNVSLVNDEATPAPNYYYGTNDEGVRGWYLLTDEVGLTCATIGSCQTIIDIEAEIDLLQQDVTDLQADVVAIETELPNKVPYTGATSDVNLGEFGVQLGNLEFDVTPTNIPTAQGSVYWDDNAETLALIMNGTTQKVGEDTFYHVRNTTGSTIPKGTAVRFAGTTGNSGRLLIAPMIANGTTPSQYYMGVTSEEILDNADGKVYQFGKMRGVNTSAFTDGDILYVSTTVAGGFQTTQPTAPNNIIVAAAVVHSANNGTLMIRPTLGSNINADEGVLITTPTDNQALIYESASSLWKNETIDKAFVGLGNVDNTSDANKPISTATQTALNAKQDTLGFTPVPTTRTLTINGTTQDLSADRTFTIATGLTVGTTPITSGTVGRVLFEGTGNVLQESANLFWDATNNRLGIGTASPAYGLDVNGTLRFGTTGNLIVTSTATELNIVRQGVTTFLTSGSAGNAGVGTISNAAFTFFTNNGAKAQITAGGNFLIGTTTDAGFKLDVNGTARVRTSSGSYTPPLTIENTGSASVDFKNVATFIGNRGSAANIDDNTNIGIQQKNNTVNNYAVINFFNSAFNLSCFIGTQFVSHASPTAHLILGTANSGTVSEKMRIVSNGNVLIGTTTDAGYKLDVNGTARFVSDIRSTTGVYIGTTATIAGIFPTGVGSREGLILRSSLIPSETGTDFYITNGQGNAANLSGTRALVNIDRGFNPTSGSGVYNIFQISPTINQTGGANGISRAIYINPTLTAAADFRAIETTRGRIVFGNLPTSSAGLPTGAIWNDAGTLKIV